MSDSGPVTSNAAEVYDEFFLPALFAAWPPRLVAAARWLRVRAEGGVGPQVIFTSA